MSTIPYEFADQQEEMFGRLLRRRFLWFAGFVLVIALPQFLYEIVVLFLADPMSGTYLTEPAPLVSRVLSLIMQAASLAVIIWVTHRFWKSSGEYRIALRYITRTLIVLGILAVLEQVLVIESAKLSLSSIASGEGEKAEQAASTLEGLRNSQQFDTFIGFGASMLIACLFIPWRWQDAAKPLYIIVPLCVLVGAMYDRDGVVLYTVLMLLLIMPGVMHAHWRFTEIRKRFDFELVQTGYRKMQQELIDARRLHDMLFPAPITEGVATVVYSYEPMRQIGGDFVFVHRHPEGTDVAGAISLVLIDVTGHGIGAALAVNRLHGEIEREFGEHPGLGPGELMEGLNTYLHHSLSKQTVFATAVCVRLDPKRGELCWTSAGHPPVFLRRAGGSIERLGSTHIMLGVLPPGSFERDEQCLKVSAGDALLAYTDGAIEAQNAEGQMLRLDRFEQLVKDSYMPAPGAWCDAITKRITDYRKGRTQDDLLLVAMQYEGASSREAERMQETRAV